MLTNSHTALFLEYSGRTLDFEYQLPTSFIIIGLFLGFLQTDYDEYLYKGWLKSKNQLG